MNKKFNPIEYIKIKEREFTQEMLKDTLKYQNKYGFNIGNNNAHNNEADAFRHAYMQSILAQRYSSFLGRIASDRHEEQGQKRGQDPREANMDLWNNRQGQQIYDEIRREYPNFNKLFELQRKNIIANKVVQKMKSGELITNLEDKRKFEKQELKLPYTPTRSIGGIQSNGLPTGFATPVGHIYTREDLKNMTKEEFVQNEKAIMKQLKERGIPTRDELEKQKSSSRDRSNSDSDSDGGHWVTINGNHVLMKD